jgi:hypothetical protein
MHEEKVLVCLFLNVARKTYLLRYHLRINLQIAFYTALRESVIGQKLCMVCYIYWEFVKFKNLATSKIYTGISESLY